MTNGEATAVAHANIALVKYWGKRDVSLNLPAVGSLSITLAALRTTTQVRFASDLATDVVTLGGHPAPATAARRVVRFLELLRRTYGLSCFATVNSVNNFPTAAGLASSASGFAALAMAATAAAGIDLTPAAMSALARQGSGSAARSLWGGFVRMARGEKDDGSDAVGHPLLPEEAWPLHVFVVLTSDRAKRVSSTEGMQRTSATSPFYGAWVQSSEDDLTEAQAAIEARDFERLGVVAEHSCLKMHGLMLSAQPAVAYWNSVSVSLQHEVWAMRTAGVPVFFTMDAGPQVKVVCLPEAAAQVRARLQAVKGVVGIIESGLGPDARLLSMDEARDALEAERGAQAFGQTGAAA